MPQRLPIVLTTLDLPLAELAAARLDGELYSVGLGFAPVDEIESPQHRARALRVGRGSRLIAEQLSAAWVWGARSVIPTRLEYCVATGARVTHSSAGWLSIREVVINDSEIVDLDGMLVTSPLRTAIDVARWSEHFEHDDARVIRALMQLGGFGLSDCLTRLDSRKSLPNKNRAIDRLSRC
jgi:hypothetical protein